MGYEERETDPERIKRAIVELERVREESGSLNKATTFILEKTGVSVTSEGLRRALARGVVGKSLANVGEKLATLPRSTTTTSATTSPSPSQIDTTDPYPNRPPAIASLRGLVDPETLDALRSVSNKGGDLSFDAWIKEGLRIQDLRAEIRRRYESPALPADPKPTTTIDASAPKVSDDDLAARAAERAEEKKRKRRKS
jgi:hypothetical protein